MAGELRQLVASKRYARDVLSGLILIVFGAFAAWYSATHYGLGTFARMQSGMFPTLLGYVLIGLGSIVLLTTFIRARRSSAADAYESVEPWAVVPLIAVTAAVAGFALTIPYFGIVPGIFVLTAMAAIADRRLKPLTIIVLAASVSALVVAIFTYGLGIRVPIVRWPL